jgi:hypothetical protein
LQQHDRHAHLVAAAEALRDWIHAQKATWETEQRPTSVLQNIAWGADPDDSIEVTADPPDAILMHPQPSAAEPDALIPQDPAFDTTAPKPRENKASDETVSEKRPRGRRREKRSRARRQIPVDAIRSVAGRGLRIGALAGAVALVGSAAWYARPYVSNVSSRFVNLATPPNTGTAVLETTPDGSDVLIDGKAAGKTPLKIELGTGRHVVEFRRRNDSRRIEIDVAGGESTTRRVDWSAVPLGRLTARSEPPGATVVVDGRERGTTPLTLEDVSVGQHVVVLQSDQGSVRRTVQVTSDEAALVSESIYAGWVKLFVPFPVEISEGSRVLRLDDQNQIMLPPGVHDLQFGSRTLGYRESRRVEVNPGQATAVSLVPPPSTLNVTASLPATVMIDGQRVGETPLADQPIALGTRDIIVRSATGAERRYTRQVTVAPIRIDVDFSVP